MTEVTNHIPAFYRDPANLNALIRNEKISHDAKLKELSIQFEGMMLKEMLNQSMGSLMEGRMQNVPGGNIYKDMIIENMADSLSRSEQFGMSKMYQKEFAKVIPKPASEKSEDSQAAAGLSALKAPAAKPVDKAQDAEPSSSAPLANDVSKEEPLGSSADQARIQSLYRRWAAKGYI